MAAVWRVASRHVVVRALALGLAYAALAKLVIFVTAFGSSAGATFWPGAGLTVAVLLRSPRSEWPYYLVAVAIAEASIDLWAGFGPALAAGWAVANTVEPLIAAALLAWRRPWRADFARRADLGPLVLAALVAGPLAGALVGTTAGVLFAGDPWLPRLPRWYVGDAIGVLVVAPALLALRPPPWGRPSPNTMLWFTALSLASLVAFGPWAVAASAGLLFLTLPVLIAIALRFGIGGAAGGMLLLAMVVEAVTASGHGPFADDGPFHGLVVAQMFVAMSSITALTVAVLTSELVTREQLESTLRMQAMRDSLTGLANRRLLFDRLEIASSRLARRPGALALLFVDLDDFKAVNDAYGHGTGDAVLMESAQRLRAIVRDHDTVARVGGDEFVILAEDIDDAGAAVGVDLAARVVAAFEQPFACCDPSLRVSVSVGVAVASDPVMDPGAFLSRSDHAMYAAKRAGGHGVATAPALL